MFSSIDKIKLKDFPFGEYKVLDNLFCYLSDDNKIVLKLNDFIVFEYNFLSINLLRLTEKFLIFSNEFNDVKLFNIDKSEIEDIKFNEKDISINNFQNFNTSNWIVYKQLNLLEVLAGIYSVDNHNIVYYKNDFYPYTILDNKIFGLLNKNNIFLYNHNGLIKWQYDLSTKYNWQQRADYIDEPDVEKQAEVIKFLGVYKNELWLVLNSGALLALNIETGTESRYIKEGKMIVGESDFENFKGYFGYDTVLDEESGLIFNLSRHFYLEYNLNSANSYFDSYSFKESSQEHKLNLNYVGGFDEEYIYSYEGSDNNCFAIFSRAKKEIIWSSEIEEVKGRFPAIRDLQYGAGKIYVLDHDNTLHIFEKEQNI